MELPPYSPDLNPIENLWNHLKRRVEKKNARNTEELGKENKEKEAKPAEQGTDSSGKKKKKVKT